MAKSTTAEFEGKAVPAEELEFDVEKEPWSVYRLEDGSVIKIKQALVSIFRLKEHFKPNGEPIYVYKLAGVANAEIPAELHKKKAD